MKAKIKAVLFALFTSVMIAVPSGIAVVGNAKGQSTTYGHGLDSCAEFLKKDKEDNNASTIYSSWVNGFMSGASVYNDTQKPFLDVADFYGIQHLIREYCKKNPLDQLSDAAKDVVEQLIDRAGRR